MGKGLILKTINQGRWKWLGLAEAWRGACHVITSIHGEIWNWECSIRNQHAGGMSPDHVRRGRSLLPEKA